MDEKELSWKEFIARLQKDYYINYGVPFRGSEVNIKKEEKTSD